MFSCLAMTSSAQFITPESTQITGAEWSSDGVYLAVVGINQPEEASEPADYDGYASVINTLSGEYRFIITPKSSFTSVAWSPDDQRLALGSFDGTIWVIDAQTGTVIAHLAGHQSTITAVDWNRSGTQIVSSGNWDQQVIVWDALNYQPLEVHTFTDFLQDVEFTPDNLSLAAGTQSGLFIIPLGATETTKKPIIATWVNQMAYDVDGRFIAVGTMAYTSVLTGLRDKARLYLFDTRTNTMLWEIESDFGTIVGLSWSPDGTMLGVLSEDDILNIYDVNSKTVLASYPIDGIGRYGRAGFAFSPYGGRLAIPSTSPTGFDILTPAPSLERLSAIAALCAPDMPPPASLDALPAFIAQLDALPEGAIPLACAADLRAVAAALGE